MSKVAAPKKEVVLVQEVAPTLEVVEKPTSASKGNRFNGVCDYRRITGEVCGKKCLRETRCAQHKDMESYSNKCKADECSRMTNSAYGFCSHHSNMKKDVKRPDHSDEVKELAQKLKDLGMSASIRKAPIKKIGNASQQKAVPASQDLEPQIVPEDSGQ